MSSIAEEMGWDDSTTAKDPASRRINASAGTGTTAQMNATIQNTPYSTASGLAMGWDEVNKLSKPKHHKISQIDNDGTIEMKDLDLHIQPTHNGFALSFMMDGDAKFYTFGCLDHLFEFVKEELPMLNLGDKKVADNV